MDDDEFCQSHGLGQSQGRCQASTSVPAAEDTQEVSELRSTVNPHPYTGGPQPVSHREACLPLSILGGDRKPGSSLHQAAAGMPHLQDVNSGKGMRGWQLRRADPPKSATGRSQLPVLC